MPPDIALVVLDDVATDDLALADTRVLSGLRSQGAWFSRFQSMPSCSPSRLAMLTGRWPRRHGVGEEVDPEVRPGPGNPGLPRDLLTLPRLLKGAGYSTALVGKWHLSAADVAADVAAPTLGPILVGGYDRHLAGTLGNLPVGPSGYFSWPRVDDGAVSQSAQYAVEAQVEAALAWLAATPGPRFLTLCLNVAHAPYHTPPEGWRYSQLGQLPTQEQRRLAMIETADVAVGLISDALPPGALLLVTSDNGTPGQGKGTTARRGITVPMLCVGPGVAWGDRAALVSCVDVYATVRDLALAPTAAHGGEDSVSFAPALTDPSFSARTHLLSERWDSSAQGSVTGEDVCVRGADWKVRLLVSPAGVETTVLHDLSADPLETTSVPVPPSDPLAAAALDELLSYLAALPERA